MEQKTIKLSLDELDILNISLKKLDLDCKKLKLKNLRFQTKKLIKKLKWKQQK